MTADMNLIDLIEQFPDEATCRAELAKLRWPEGVACIRCGSTSIWDIEKRAQYECKDCHYRFSVTAGTVLNDSHLPLRKWFMATYLIVEAKKSISSRQLGRTLKVARKTEWFLSHRIREAMTQAMANDPLLDGVVEIDEMYVGGVARGKGRGYKKNKTMVMGAVERNGDVRFSVPEEPHASRKAIRKFLAENVSPDVQSVYTDEWAAYKGMGIGRDRTVHQTVDHKAEEWVRGPVHTNTIEGTWSLFNRALVGSWHQVQRKHLPAYLEEMRWRANNRENPHLFRDTLKALVSSEAMEYKALTGKA